VPRLLFSKRFTAVLGHAALSATDRGINVTPMFLFRKIVAAVLSLFGKAGRGR
jgi:hypothetical protein